MIQLLKVFVDIALWRKGPEHLPASTFLLVVALIAYCLLNLVLANLVARPGERWVVRTLIETALVLIWLWTMLRFFGHGARFRQTAIAVLGTTALLAPILIGLNGVLVLLGRGHVLATPFYLALLIAIVWYVLVTAHIVRSALELHLLVAVVITLLYIACEYFITERLLGLSA